MSLFSWWASGLFIFRPVCFALAVFITLFIVFGTVFGIMEAFLNIAASGQADLAEVSGPIAEALVTTALALASAVPAVVAYNYLRRQVKKTLISSDALNQQLLFRLRASTDEG